jgi:ribosomal-protein-alanine N-acetyltransferase
MLDDIDIVEEIQDDKILIKKIHKVDYRFLYESLNDEKVTQYLSLGPLRSIDHAKRLIKSYLRSWNNYNQFNYIIKLNINGKIESIGSVTLWNISWLHRRAEIGIWIIPAYWNQGIGVRAINLVKQVAFNNLHLHRIEAHVAKQNISSIEMFRKANFIEEGLLKDYLILNDNIYDAVLLRHLNVS